MIKLIAGCPHCKRQYDATGRASGSLFHCYCGQVVTVPTPKDNFELTVVRCSSCGAAREGGAAACTYCKSDFTLHERDLNTICSQCANRISSKAKFCHSCGTRVSAQDTAGAVSDRECPACDEPHKMHSRQLGEHNISVLECDKCAGIWLNHSCFEVLQDAVLKLASEELQRVETSVAKEASPPTKFRYRKCPHCSLMMARKNYGNRSGIILDVCPQHGVWFDQDELARILSWVRKGGLTAAQREELDELNRRTRALQDIAAQSTDLTDPHSLGYIPVFTTASFASSLLRMLFK